MFHHFMIQSFRNKKTLFVSFFNLGALLKLVEILRIFGIHFQNRNF